MPVDAFILFVPAKDAKMMAVPGETQDDYFGSKKEGENQWFEIKDFSFGVENKATIGSATGGAGGGKIQFNEFQIKKTTDLASCAFFKNCAAGAHYELVRIAIRKSGGGGIDSTGKPYLIFDFGTVFTTKIDWSGPGDEGPEEAITFAFGALQLFYASQKADGTMGVTKQVGWDQVKNKGEFPVKTTPLI